MLEDRMWPWEALALFGDDHAILRGLQVTQKSTPSPVLTHSALLQCSKQLCEIRKIFIRVTIIIVLPWVTVLIQTNWYYGLQFIWLNKNMVIVLANEPFQWPVSDKPCVAIWCLSNTAFSLQVLVKWQGFTQTLK